MKPARDAIGEAWNVQSGEKVYPMHFGTSDVDGILLALKEAGYVIVPTEFDASNFTFTEAEAIRRFIEEAST